MRFLKKNCRKRYKKNIIEMKTVEKKEQEELFREVTHTKKTSLVLCRQDKEEGGYNAAKAPRTTWCRMEPKEDPGEGYSLSG